PSLTRTYAISRLFRIYPVVIATIAVYAAVGLAQGRPWPLADLALNAALVKIDINGVFWTLQSELIGSALVLGLYLAERRWGLWPAAVAALVLTPFAFAGHAAELSEVFAVRYFATFPLGFLLAAAKGP